jgi:3-hydroxyisobutyrate dehydrogenase-like beta-hydroxyacid dehydrogenase
METPSKARIGLIGLGLMGRPMGMNLLKAGHPLTVWNRTASRADELVAAGATLAKSPKEAAAGADVLLTMVSDPQALEEVLWGSNAKNAGEAGVRPDAAALPALKNGSIYIDSSTVSPDLARKIAAACAEQGVRFLDAPVTGGDWGAKKGELVFMIGGDADTLKAVEPILGVMGKKWFHLGPNGAGQTIKLAMNSMLALQVEGLAEALVLVTAAGLKGESLVEVMQSSMARSGLLDVKAPNLLKGEYVPSFPLRLMYKDICLALGLARQLGVTLPAATAAAATYGKVKEATKEDLDYSAVMRFWRP